MHPDVEAALGIHSTLRESPSMVYHSWSPRNGDIPPSWVDGEDSHDMYQIQAIEPALFGALRLARDPLNALLVSIFYFLVVRAEH